MTDFTDVIKTHTGINPTVCHQAVVSDIDYGEMDACHQPAVALMRPWDSDGPNYPVCAGHIQPALLVPINEWEKTDD